ncbi:Methyl-accepting chemotaxis protein [Sulfidibacter corallicola]|uniref:Methyl-accepting chemotaxis protein n=1 Tax=Sulfidibacter corallicola TaxID=2818388 RepID=A0A8A4THZ2_SULCO|nr:methyl-accepting chemotaxis protein [Sulfidibacter corallicola]QTD49180.1 methyl-accepting chemotaxis protein [Sulfidibacter corallicola]
MFANRSIRWKVLTLVASVFLVVTAATSWLSIRDQSKYVLENAEKHVDDLADGYFDALNTMMLTGTIARRDILQRKMLANPEVIGVRTIRSDALNKQFPAQNEHESAQDDYDLRALDGEVVSILHEEEIGRVITMIKPAIAKSEIEGEAVACTSCHLVPDGTVLGAVRIDFSLAERDQATRGHVIRGIVVDLLLLTLGLLFLAVALNRMILIPLKRMRSVVGKIADGDLTPRLEVKANDEMGQMARWLNNFVHGLGQGISGIQRDALMLADSADDLVKVSRGFSEGAAVVDQQVREVAKATSDMGRRLDTVAQSTGEINGSLHTVSSSSHQVTENMKHADGAVRETDDRLSSLAVASGEMSDTIGQISQNAGLALDVSQRAVDSASRAQVQIQHLSAATHEIDSVIAAIEEIAEVTQTLALNATIEAARAGLAGRGFSVVAAEVRELAKETNAATARIQQCVTDMGKSTRIAVTEIQNINAVIGEVNQRMNQIATAVDQQNQTTRQNADDIQLASSHMNQVTDSVGQASREMNRIAENLTRMVDRTERVSGNVGKMAKGTKAITGNMDRMAETSSGSRTDADRLRESAGEMAKMAASLQSLVAKYRVPEEQN